MKVTNIWCGQDIKLPMTVSDEGKFMNAEISWDELCNENKITMEHVKNLRLAIACLLE